jgi:CheY-like chemotaxis protein
MPEGDQSSLLVVDDEPFNHKLIKRLLDAEGYTNATFAENGRQALDMLQETKFDIVLLDIEMPELDGFEVLKTIKADLNNRHIPVIMISGVEDTESIAKCIELGAEDYLSKPFNATILRARLGACVEKKRLRDQEKSHLDQIRAERKKADGLLTVILPAGIASELKATGHVIPRAYDNVGLLFCDIVGFTDYCSGRSAEEVVSGLQALFTKFEEITTKYQMEKIKTIGDEFMSVAGLTSPDYEPLLTVVKCGLEMAAAAPEVISDWKVRVGVHSGPVVAGIVGNQKYQFDVWGDTVNVAARMAGTGNPGAVTMTHESWLDIESDCQGKMLGKIDIKGKGPIDVVECTGLL